MSKSTVISREEFIHICEQREVYTELVLTRLQTDNAKRKRLLAKLDAWRNIGLDHYNAAAPRHFPHAVKRTASHSRKKTQSWEFITVN